MSDLSEKVTTSIADLSASLERFVPVVGTTKEQGTRTGDYHSEIDSAVAYTQQGSPDVALAQLEQLRKQRWDQLSARERFRVVANIGHAHNAKDQYSKAARHFIDCQQYQPEDEQARCLAAIGHAILGDCTLAFQLAAGICADFPNSDLGHATWVRNAPADMSFASVEAGVPRVDRAAVNTACALSYRALDAGETTAAETYARVALEHDKKSRMLREQLAVVLLQAAKREAAGQYAESPRLTAPEKLREAELHLVGVLEETPLTLFLSRSENTVLSWPRSSALRTVGRGL